MKFILSFLIATTILSADTCLKLSLGNAALTPTVLCSPVNILPPVTPILCPLPILQIPTVPTIQCNLPTITPTPAPVLTQCTPAPIICPTPTPVEGLPTGNQCNPTPTPTPSPSNPCATPEPASYALLGAGLMTAGIARKFYKK